MSTTVNDEIPPDYQFANPLLYVFRDYDTGIQPYFLIALQFLSFEICLRGWNRVVYGTWDTSSEIVMRQMIPLDGGIFGPPRGVIVPNPVGLPPLSPSPSSATWSSSIFRPVIYMIHPYDRFSIRRRKKNKDNIPVFDLFHIILVTLPLLAHSIWYCVIQSSCMSGEFATVWNCYNLFGYRIYNYIFSRFASFSTEFISKLQLFRLNRKALKEQHAQLSKFKRIYSSFIFFTGLITSSITFLFVGGLILPYSLTHAIPMMIVYSFIVVIFVYIMVIITLIINLIKNTTRNVVFTEDQNFFKRQLQKLHDKSELVVLDITLRSIQFITIFLLWQ